jgi:hypothetical protein
MRPELEAATAKLEADQAAIDKKVADGAYHSKRRDAAISNLIKLAASDEFRKRVSLDFISGLVYICASFEKELVQICAKLRPLIL